MLIFTVGERAHLNLLVAELHGAGKRRTKSSVNFSDVRIRYDRFYVRYGELSAGHHGDSPVGMLYEIFECRHGIHRAFFAAGSENAVCANLYQVFQRLLQVARHIKCPMARDFEGTRNVNQLPHSLVVQGAVSIQNAEYYSSGPKLFGNQDVALHDAELICAVTEVSAAWANHYLQADANLFAHCGDHTGTGRGAAFGKARAKFNAVCAAAL